MAVEVASIAVGMVLRSGSFFNALDGVLDRAAGTVTGWGKKASVAISAPLTGLAVVAGKAAINFDKEMRNVNATLLLSEDEFEALKQKVLELSLETRASSADVARSLLMIAHAGTDAADQFELLDVASHAAGAGLTTTAATTKLLIATMRAYGMEVGDAQEIIDRFIYASQRGAGTFEELTQTVGHILPLAAAAGVSIEEVTGALATLRKGGLSAAASSVSLQRIMQKLLDPTDEMATMFEEAGYASGLAAVQELGLAGAIRIVSRATGEQADQIISATGMVQAWRGMLILAKDDVQGLDAASRMMGEGFEGAMGKAREQQYKSFTAQMSRLKSALEVLGIALFDEVLPPLIDLVKQAVPIVRSFAKMDDKTKKLIITLIGIGIALGPVLLIAGQFIGLISGVAGILGFLFGPGGILVLGLIALVALVPGLASGLGGILDKIKEMVPALEPIITKIQEFIAAFGWDTPWEDFFPPWLADIIYTIVDALKGVRDFIRSIGWDTPWEDFFPPWLANIIYTIVGAFEKLRDLDLGGFTEKIRNFFTNLDFGALIPTGANLEDLIGNLIDKIASWLELKWPTINAKLNAWAERFWGWVSQAIIDLEPKLTELMDKIEEWAYKPETQNRLVRLGHGLGMALVDALEFILKNDAAIAQCLMALTYLLLNTLARVAAIAIHVGWDIAVGVISGILEKLDAKNWVPNLKQKIVDGLNQIGDAIKEWFAALPWALTDSMQGVVDAVAGAFEDLQVLLVGESIIPDMITDIVGAFGGMRSAVAGEGVGMVHDLATGMGGQMGGLRGALPGGTMGGMAGALQITNYWDASISSRDRAELAKEMENTVYGAMAMQYGGA